MGMHFLSYNVTNILVPTFLGLLNVFIFAFSVPSFSVGVTLHVAYKKYEIKEHLLLFGKKQINLLSVLKTSEISLVLRTREDSDVFNTLDEINLVFT